jgi:Domain of unknown function (DUF4440)
MKKIALCFWILSLAIQGLAQKTDSDSASVVHTTERFHQAMVDAQMEVLDELLAEKLTYWHSNGMIDNKVSLMATLQSGNTDYLSIKSSDFQVVIDKKLAVVRQKFVAEATSNGKNVGLNLQVLLVLAKEKKRWKIVARQGTKL